MGKRTTVLLVVFMLFGLNSHAQLRKGHRIFEAYYGFPNFGVLTGTLTKNAVQPIIEKHIPELDKRVGVELNGFGPLGGRYEHLLSDRFAFTFAFVYNTTTVGFQIDSFRVEEVYVDNIEVKYKMSRYRGLFGFNYHFVNRPKWDCYFGLSAGFNYRSHKISTSKVNTNIVDIPSLSAKFAGSYPYAARTNIGFRFYPVQQVGIGMEFGLGGPLVSGGVSIRLNARKKHHYSETAEPCKCDFRKKDKRQII